jgi:hypothetical protein
MKANLKTSNKQQPAWLYDGEPEYVPIVIDHVLEGGYIIALVLEDGIIRLSSTQNPSKLITAWNYSVRCRGATSISRVLVSRKFLRYESVKRVLAGKLCDYKTESGGYQMDVEALTEKAREVFSVAGI